MVRLPAELKIYLVTTASKLPDRLWDPSSFLFNEYQGCFSGGNRSGCKAEHLLSCGPEGEHEGHYTTSLSCDVVM